MDTTTTKPRSIRSFLLLLTALSIPLWILGTIYDVQIFPGLNLYQLPLAMSMVTALILIYRESGGAGVRTLLQRMYDFRKIRSKIWYLPILLVVPSIGFVEYWVLRFSGVIIPPPSFSFAVLFAFISYFFMAYTEELGWTGYLLDPLLARGSALKAGVLVGLVWAGIHVPILLINGYSAEWVFWHALYTTAVRVLMVWIYVHVGRSLFAMTLAHATFGLFWAFWPVENLHRVVSFYDPRIMALTAIAYVAVVVWLWGPKTLADYRFARKEVRATLE